MSDQDGPKNYIFITFCYMIRVEHKKFSKCQNITAINILIQSKFPHKNEFFNVFNFNSVK